MARRRCGSVSIDISEIIDAVDDDDLLDEVASRKLIVGSGADFVPEDDLREAYAELLRGRPSEALAILDRLINPKWRSTKFAEAALRAMKPD